MMTARFVLGVSLFVLLIVDTCSLSIPKGAKQAPPGSGNTYAVGNYASNQVAPPSHHHDYSHGHHQHPSALLGEESMPVAQREPVVAGGSSSSVPVQSGYSAGYMQPGPATNQDIDWLVQPSLSGHDRHSGPAHDHGSAGSEEMSQFLPPPPPPEPEYQGGELSNFEKTAETGDYQSETEELGYPPYTPVKGLPGPPTFPGQPLFGPGGYWGRGYPYFDYMFLTGQYPPGTLSHFSHNLEQGNDYWHDTHFEKEHPPTDPGNDQQYQTFPGDHTFPQKQTTGYPGSSQRGAAQPGRL